MKEEEPKFIWSVIALAMILIYVLFFASCKVVKEVPVETIKERIEYIDRIEYDSIYKRDSIYIKAIGETIYCYKDKYVYKYQFIHDTTFVSQVDSIPYTIEVEKPFSRWEVAKLKIGGFAISLLFILLLVAIGWGVRKIIK